MPTEYGYVRVSTAEQNEDLQISALIKSGCKRENIYKDVGISGSQESRPQFDILLSRLETGDTFKTWRLDRTSRSLKHLIGLNERFKAQGVIFESLTEKIDTSTGLGEFVFHILAAVAQLELSIIRERTLAGLQEAKEKGNFPGRPRKLSPGMVVWAVESYLTAHMSTFDIADELGVHPETIRRCFRRLRETEQGAGLIGLPINSQIGRTHAEFEWEQDRLLQLATYEFSKLNEENQTIERLCVYSEFFNSMQE